MSSLLSDVRLHRPLGHASRSASARARVCSRGSLRLTAPASTYLNHCMRVGRAGRPSSSHLKRLAPQAGFEPATLRLTAEKTALAALCRGVLEVAGSRAITRRSDDFRPSLCAGACCHLPRFGAAKGQEKGNVDRRSITRPRSGTIRTQICSLLHVSRHRRMVDAPALVNLRCPAGSMRFTTSGGTTEVTGSEAG